MAKKSKTPAANNIFQYLNNNVNAINNSKIFAGLMIIILNISSKFVTIKLSKTMESYLKYTFSRDILVFAIAWMGTRDIYIALLITIVFVICVEYVFNEDSMFCCLPEHVTEYHVSLLETGGNDVTPEEIKKAEEILEKAKKQQSSPGLQFQKFTSY
jgi:hypothetical protein